MDPDTCPTCPKHDFTSDGAVQQCCFSPMRKMHLKYWQYI
uniref:Uncharacterized protein n=1 Tax=Anguilla anguilla TaxID=7936 RepID=A0A0E9QT51_ANGAN